jgi:hypothetical protein
LAVGVSAVVFVGCASSGGGVSVSQVNDASAQFNTALESYLTIQGPGNTTDVATWSAWEDQAATKVGDMQARFSTWSDLLDRSGKASSSMKQYRDSLRTWSNDQAEQSRLAKSCVVAPAPAPCFSDMISVNSARWNADAAAVNVYLHNPPQGGQLAP